LRTCSSNRILVVPVPLAAADGWWFDLRDLPDLALASP